MYSAIKKNKNDTWDNVSRRMFGTTERSGDLEKLNNSIEDGEIIVFDNDDEEINPSLSDCAYIEINETIYKDFSESTLINSLGAIRAAVFVFLCPNGESCPFKNGESVKVYNKEGLFLKGRITNIKPVKNKKLGYYQIEIKSQAGILIESDIPNTLDFGEQTLGSVILELAGCFGLEVEFCDDNFKDEIFKNEIGTSFSAKENEKAFNFLYRICESRGYVLYDTGTKLKVFKLDDTSKEKINLIEGECIGVNSIRADFITDGLARYYEVSSQFPAFNKTIVTVPYLIPVTRRLATNDINSSNIEETALRLVCKEVAKHFNVTVGIGDNLILSTGDIVIVKYPSIGIDEETEFVVKTVIVKNPDTIKAVLTLPCAYLGVMPEKLPMTLGG